MNVHHLLSAYYKAKKRNRNKSNGIEGINESAVCVVVCGYSKPFNLRSFISIGLVYRIDPTGIFAKMDRFGLNEANVLHSVTSQPDIDDPGELSR